MGRLVPPGAVEWFDWQMEPLSEFETTITLGLTPPSRGHTADCTSPRIDLGEFAQFATAVIERYVVAP